MNIFSHEIPSTISHRLIIYLLLMYSVSVSIHLNAQVYHLDSVVVVAKKFNGITKQSFGQYEWKMKSLSMLPKIMGNSDPLHYMKYIPGIQTGSELDAGLHIHGCDNEHNEVSLFGVPVYQATHLLGLFSVFNPSHFSTMDININSQPTASNRLGGNINMKPITEPIHKVKGEFTVGPMSSQGTLKIPINKKLSVVASARQSYLNLLYSKWLEFDGTQLHYSFCDYNFTCLYQPNDRDKLWINSYYGYDNAKLNEEGIHSDINVKWSNFLVSLHWEHLFKSSNLMQYIYLTRHENTLIFRQTDSDDRLPSDIQDIGYVGKWKSKYIDIHALAAMHAIHPQENLKIQNAYPTDNLFQRTQEYSLMGYLHLPLSKKFELGSGLKGCIYVDDYNKTYYGILPKVNLKYFPSNRLKFNLEYSYQKQYLFQTGFTDMGMPTEFWSSCEKGINPQGAHSFSLNMDYVLGTGNWSITSAIYYKRLTNQVEYIGSITDFLSSDYRLKDQLISGTGKNYGINLMLNKRTGKLTGWLGYSWNRAFRYFNHPNFPHRYPANHERIHEFKALLTYIINPKWEVGSTVIVASGLPFTAPKYFYSSNGQILTEFGPHNEGRLKPYYRIDVSVNYNFNKTNKKENGINLSLYNASMHGNELFYRLKFYNGRFAYRPFKFLVTLLPSISYYHKF